jgi:hypothetical protein
MCKHIMRTPVYSLKIRTLISKFDYTVFFEIKKRCLINFCLSFPEHLKRSYLIKNRDFDDFNRKSFIGICCIRCPGYGGNKCTLVK